MYHLGDGNEQEVTMAKKADPMEGYTVGRPFGNSPRILKRSGAGVHGKTGRRRNRDERRRVRQELRGRTLEGALLMM